MDSMVPPGFFGAEIRPNLGWHVIEWSWTYELPFGKQPHSYGKKTSTLIGRSSTNGLFSIAMLVCWRVGPVKFPHSFGLPPVGQSWLRSSESGCWMTRFPNLHTAIAMYRCIHITHMCIYIYTHIIHNYDNYDQLIMYTCI